MYRRLASWCFSNRRIVVLLWVLGLVGFNVTADAIGDAFNGEFSIPASESADGFKTLEEHFPGSGGSITGSVVFQADQGVEDPEVVAAMEELFSKVEATEIATITSPYSQFGAQQVSPDGLVAYAQVNFDLGIEEAEAVTIGTLIQDEAPELEGLTVEVGGASLAFFEPPESELIGLAFAIVVLILAFGSVLAMGLPIGVAVFGVGTAAGVISLVTHLFSVPEFAPVLGAMIGLGVGIDYALFIVTRYREGTKSGLSPQEATLLAMDTAGRAVVFAGITVVISLLGMLLMGLAFMSGLGIAASITVAITMAASMTLLPALLGFAGDRVEVTRWRGLVSAGLVAFALLGLGLGISWMVWALGAAAVVLVAGSVIPALRKQVPRRAEKPMRETFAYKWSRVVQSNAWLSLALGGGLLLLMSIPLLSIRLGFSDEGNYGEETTTRRAYDLIAEGFGPGSNGPFLVAVEIGSPDDVERVASLAEAIGGDEGVAAVGQPYPSNLENPEESAAFLINVIPATAPQDAATVETVERLREEVIPSVTQGSTLEANITGAVPSSIDFTGYLSRRLFVFLGVVLAVSFVLLMAVFRSLLVPLKAVVMNMLSISAAYGVVVAVFQWGWLGGLTGIEPAPIEPFIPMMMFAIVFGLSMDYEVFLLSRVKEEFDRTGDPIASVADGLAATARVITAAAAIMVVVFGSFLFEDTRIIKLFGVGLATAVLLDATLVRMLLVPATMKLLGSKNWWLPEWLDRLVPTIHVEGPSEDPALDG